MEGGGVSESFAAAIVNGGLLTVLELDRAQQICDQSGKRLAATVSRLGLLSDGQIADIFSATTGFPLIDRPALLRARDYTSQLNLRFLERHALLPIEVDRNRLKLAMADPEDGQALRAMMFAFDIMEVEPLVASFGDIAEALAKFTPNETQALQVDQFVSARAGEDLVRLNEDDSEAPVIRLVQRLLVQAVNRRASDVHIEPMARQVLIRYRIDGHLVEIEKLPENLTAPIASRVKILAGLDIAECRLPQDGRLRLTVKGRDVDVRVSTSPTAYGESLVLRLLGRSAVTLDLDTLGLPDASLAKFKTGLERSHGMILVTGPTGSGKTTTLYAAIQRLQRPEVKILTVEDPVEVLIEGVNQVQVRPEIELDFAASLRAFLRQDPDILMVGEIRDGETADIAMRAALTGHLVLSTLHTNSAIGAFTRLKDIGVEPYLTASTVIASIAQRLVRGLCENCCAARRPAAEDIALFLSVDLTAPEIVYDPLGCDICNGTGYLGRLPIFEYFEVDEVARAAIRDGSIVEWDDAPRMDSLLVHGLKLVDQGKTSIAEVRRAVNIA